MGRLLFFIGVLSNVYVAFGQQTKVDSLELEFRKSTHDTIKLEILKNISNQYISTDIDLAETYIDSMIRFARNKNLFKYELTGLSAKGVIKYRQGLYKEGLSIWQNALKKPFVNEHPIQKGNLYHNISVGYSIFHNIDSSLYYVRKSMVLNEELNNLDALSANYGFIAEHYQAIKENDSAFFYLNKMLAIAEQSKNEINTAQALIKLGTFSRAEYDYEGSISQYSKALEIFKRLEPNNLIMHRGVAYEIAKTKLSLGNYTEALSDLLHIDSVYNDMSRKETFQVYFNNNLLKTYLKVNDKVNAKKMYLKILNTDTTTIQSQKDLMYYHLNLADYEIAYNIQNIKTKEKIEYALDISKKIDDPFDFKNIYNSLSKYYYNEGKHKESYTYLQTTINYLDSIHSIESKAINIAQKRKFNEALKEKENLQLKTEKAEHEKLLAIRTKRNWQLGGGLATTMVGLGVFFIVFRKNQKQKKEIESQKNKVEHLQKELHHRLKNNLAFIDVFITLAKGKFPDPAYRDRLSELQNRIKSMFEIHEQLFRKEDITSVNAQNYISKLAENVKAAYANPNIAIEQHIDPAAELDSQTSFPMGIIINEFVTNSYKYAFNPDQQGIIKIELNGTPEFYRLMLSDNGKGLPENFDVNKSNTFGLESIKLLTQEYKGTYSLFGERGVMLEITLPKPTTL